MENKLTKRIGILYFSQTNTTKRICKAIALGMGANAPVDLNLTKPEFRTKLISNPDVVLENIDHLVVGVPVYIGKIPVQAIECLKVLKGNEKRCTAVVVYGNRDYGVAFRNLVEILTKKGFKINAAGAFIGQHTYSDIIPVAIGRPDKTDLEKASQFGTESLNTSKYLTPEDIPVQLDMFSRSKYYSSLKPVFLPKECTQCGTSENTVRLVFFPKKQATM
jgi:flavodoxin